MRGGCANTISGVRSPVRFAAMAANTAAFPVNAAVAGEVEADTGARVVLEGGAPVGAAAPVTVTAVVTPNNCKEMVAVLPGGGAEMKKSSVKFTATVEGTEAAVNAISLALIEFRLKSDKIGAVLDT